MNKQAPALTVDSLIKFKNKKNKFSFTNKRLQNEQHSDEDTKNEEKENDDENSAEPPCKSVARQPKGSALLKNEDSDSSSSSSSNSNYEKKKKKKKHEKIESPSKKNETNLLKLVTLFPNMSKEEITNAWKKCKFNSKKCIDYLLKEKENKNKLMSSSSSSDEVNEKTDAEIEEWSDGDPGIRARNEEAKMQRKEDKKNKRKSEEGEEDEKLKEPSKKKFKKFIVDSEDDDDEEKKKPSVSVSSSAATTSSSSLTDLSQEDKVKKTGKKSYIQLSSDEESDNGGSKKKDKHHNKHKKKNKKKEKKSKKHKNRFSDDEDAPQADDDDENFDKSDADGGSTDSNDEDNLSDGQKAAILSLFSEASLEEIMSMINITKKKIQTLLALRPFANFKDLQNKLNESKLSRVIDAAKDVIYARSIVNNLLTKCEQISKKMEDQVARLIESDPTENNTNKNSHKKKNNHQLELKSQPKCLNESLSLKPYQLIGLNWLCLMHKENINGILADEMGLGKTCQTIAFLSHLFELNPKLMHLIVVPPSTLDNWVREISTWCPEFNFTVYQGSIEERRNLRYDVLNNRFVKPLNAILTSYGMLSSSNEDKAFFRKLKIEYCIYDEAHMLKNMNSIRYQSLIKINSKRRLLLTGTPLQNNLVELMSLLYFVMPEIFEHKTDHLKKIFESKPVDVDKDTFYNEKIVQAKGIMRPFIMRRLKNDVLKQLPKKIVQVIYCEQTERQSNEYEKLIRLFRERKANDVQKSLDTKASKANKDKTIVEECNELKNSIVNNEEDSTKAGHILMELRKAANHPLLRRSIYDDDRLKKMAKLVMAESSADTVYEYVLEDMSVMSDFQLHKLCFLYRCLKGYELAEKQILDSGKFKELEKLLKEKTSTGSRVLVFSQFVIMLDILEEFLKIKSYKYCRLDGNTAISERQDLIDEYNDKESDISVFLLSTKAGGMGINLTAANVVVMHDIDYNPFNDKQAEDRCHRVGQTKTVEVYKLISKESIDETMLKIQTRKLELDSDIVGDNEEVNSKADMVSMLNEALKIK